MIKYILNICALAFFSLGATAQVKTDDVIKAGGQKGEYIISTDKITQGENFYGYAEQNIPLRIYVLGDKITKVEAYGHRESPRYFAQVERKLLPYWTGKTLKQSLSKSPDAVTGATYSSQAVIKSVEAGLKYAKKRGLK